MEIADCRFFEPTQAMLNLLNGEDPEDNVNQQYTYKYTYKYTVF